MKITKYTVYAVLHCDFLPCLQHLMHHNLGPVWHRPSSLHQACKTSISCYRIIALYNCGAFKSKDLIIFKANISRINFTQNCGGMVGKLKFSTKINEMHPYLTNVLTFATSMSYNFLTASLTCGLFDLLSTMNTRVLLSSIFFMADSVVRGNFTMLNRSNLRQTKKTQMSTPSKTETSFIAVLFWQW